MDGMFCQVFWGEYCIVRIVVELYSTVLLVVGYCSVFQMGRTLGIQT